MTISDSEIWMRSLAGLGLFFFGIKMIARNLSAMAGDQFRRRLHAASEGLGSAALFGATAGFITQSGRTTSFILASFVQAGLIQARRALPIVLWANFGCTLVIFTAVFPIYLFALFLLAVAGVCIAFERPKPLLNAASATFGLALMLFGLQMMSSSASVLPSFSWFVTALAVIKTSLAFAFLTGLALTLVTQSHIAIILIAVTMAGRGIFDFDQTLMVIYGAHAGSSAITYVTGIHFKGQPRQLVAAQVLYNLFGVALFLLLFAGQRLLFGATILEKATSGVAPGTAAALAAAILNTVTPLILTFGLGPFARLCESLAPPLAEEELARPQFLRAEVGDNPVVALMLAEKEQLRLLQRLPAYLAAIRGDSRDGPTPQAYHDAFILVGRWIERYQNALMSQPMTPEDTEWLLNQQKRQEALAAIDEACFELSEAISATGPAAVPLRDSLVEALDALLLTAISGAATADADELDALVTMTRNRGPAMERMRRKYLALSDGLSPEERNAILQATSLYERAAWALNRFAVLLHERLVQAAGVRAEDVRRAPAVAAGLRPATPASVEGGLLRGSAE